MRQRYRIFFFLGKVCGHSLTRIQELLYFFFPKTGKKKIQVYFFFSSKKFTCHSLNFSGGALIKNKGESYIFPKMPILTPFYVVFFFPEVCIFFSCIFFSWKKFKLHSLTRFKPCIFFSGTGKKNTPILLTHSIFDENVTNVNFSRK